MIRYRHMMMPLRRRRHAAAISQDMPTIFDIRRYAAYIRCYAAIISGVRGHAFAAATFSCRLLTIRCLPPLRHFLFITLRHLRRSSHYLLILLTIICRLYAVDARAFEIRFSLMMLTLMPDYAADTPLFRQPIATPIFFSYATPRCHAAGVIEILRALIRQLYDIARSATTPYAVTRCFFDAHDIMLMLAVTC